MIGHADVLPMKVNSLALSGMAVENTIMVSEWLKDGKPQSNERLAFLPPA